MAQIKVTIMKDGEPAPNAVLVYNGNNSKTANGNGEITWTVSSGFKASYNFNIIYADDTLGPGGAGFLVRAGDDIELGA
jgi:hypothetical protein